MPQSPVANGDSHGLIPAPPIRSMDQSSPDQLHQRIDHHSGMHGFVEHVNLSVPLLGSVTPSFHSPLQRVLSSDGDALHRPASSQATFQGGLTTQQRMKRRNRVLDAKTKLKKEEDGVVKRRDGGVLARGFILKTDHYPTGRALDLDIHLEGAPNWRAPREESLNVYGTAQPTLSGLRSILSLLGCRDEVKTEDDQQPTTCVWFCTREEPIIYISGKPFVLRDGSVPKTTLALSDRAENLEGIEDRLKSDILKEAKKYGGLIMTHDELEDGTLMKTWTAIDVNNLLTVKEAWQQASDDGWLLEYHRIPISSERPVEDNYLDAYVKILQAHDPLSSCLVFNDGMGAVRATFAMCAAALVRRKRYLSMDLEEPFASLTGTSTPIHGIQASQFFKQTAQQQSQNKALLRLTHLLERRLQSADIKVATSATDLLGSNMPLLESLRNAIMGNYQVILSLLSFLDRAKEVKTLVDHVIDSCDAVVNLREEVIKARMHYSTVVETQVGRQKWLDRALYAMEKYFVLIAFASYVEEEDGGMTGKTFASWLETRPEIWNMIKTMRRRGGGRLFIFAPINDLTPLSKVTATQQAEAGPHEEDHQPDVVDDEFSLQVVSQRAGIILRPGTVLKSDRWLVQPAMMPGMIRGAPNLRRVPEMSVWTLGQPSSNAITDIVRKVQKEQPLIKKVLWVNLREEPLVMVAGEPYCLRKANMTLRNLKDYSGVSGQRLETLEDRLISDATAELRNFDGRLLLHTESPQGVVAPVWEDLQPEEIQTMRRVMESARSSITDLEVSYRRLPITAESVLDDQDITDLIAFCVKNDENSAAIILNDQLGRGRSTLASIAICLIYRWLRSRLQSNFDGDATQSSPVNSRSSWQLVNSCLRTLPSGLRVKRIVDEVIDLCSETFQLRESIETIHQRAEETKQENVRKGLIKDGKTQLGRYLQLIQLQAYLESQSMEMDVTFGEWYKERPVLRTFANELKTGDLEVLAPVGPEAEGSLASTDDAMRVIVNRSGAILASGLIIKVDLFLGLQKASLPDRVDGAANFRRVPLLLGESLDDNGKGAASNRAVYGTGMPTAEGLRNALERMGAAPQGSRKILWTSLREEPVIYIEGSPHVLRLLDSPISNIETTGVAANVVENMEIALKRDILQEMRSNGRILLHDEVETQAGHFELSPVWKVVTEDDLLTPRELYNQVVQEGFHVDYNRIAITDEQAPLPAALKLMLDIVEAGLRSDNADFTYNCQMGRGRTSSGMITASITASIMADVHNGLGESETLSPVETDWTEERAYLNGEFKMILKLVSVLAHGKEAKNIVDRCVDAMSGVQNLREAIYDFKLRIDAADPASKKAKDLTRIGLNYAFRYGLFIVLADYLLERRQSGTMPAFDVWYEGRREIRSALSRQVLD